MSLHKLTIASLLAVAITGCGDDDKPAAPADAAPIDSLQSPAVFTLDSPDLANGTFSDAQVASTFGCTGQNRSPALRWSNPPEGTKSFAITMFDPDAPTGSGFWHWTVFNIPAATTSLAANAAASTGGSLPAGAIQGYTDFGAPGYGGPCPPPGDAPHRYVFKIYALSVDSLGLTSAAPGALVSFSALGSSLGTATFMANYSIGTPVPGQNHPEPPTLANFALASDDVVNGVFKDEQILNSFGCTGGNVSPELHWSDPPPGTKSLALSVFDPDAPTGSGFWHWLAFDIDATLRSIPNGEGNVFPGVQAYNDTGVSAYAGPCPPAADGPHHYVFTLYAMPVETLTASGLSSTSTGALLGFNTRAMAIARATFTATYDR